MSDAATPKPKSRRRRRRRKPRAEARVARQQALRDDRGAAAPKAREGTESEARGAAVALRLNTDDPFGMCDPDADAPAFESDDAASDSYWPEQAEESEPAAEEQEAPLVLCTVVGEPTLEREPAPQAHGFGGEPRASEGVRIPRIVVHASCERVEVAEAIAAAAEDPRLARAEFTIESGGIDGAVARLARAASPDLLIVDSTLAPGEMLRRLEKLADVIFEETKVIVVGAVNDITFFRDLTARGVSDYVVAPIAPKALADTLVALYGDAAGAPAGGRVIAVTGARGGVGASALARNIAWSIAERQEASAALIDLDLRFSAATPAPAAQFTIVDALQALEKIDEEEIEHFGTLRGRRLRVLGARSTLTREIEVQGEAISALIAHMRRTAPYVVLDLPHVWTPWAAQTLARADRAVIVAVRDLASLRNAKNMLEALKAMREEGAAAPDVVLSLVGTPGRPEIPVKDMTEVLGAAPIASVPFDAYAFGAGEAEGLMVDECAPGSRAALAIDALAAQLTGRKIVRRARGKAAPAVPLAITPATEAYYPPPPRRRREDLEAAKPASAAAPASVARATPAVSPASAPRVCEPVAAPPRSPARGDAARYARALEQIQAGRARKGASLLRVVAEQGLAPAQHRLAQLYERGEGVSGDLARARQWAERAAQAGHVQAMYALGLYCARGEGGAKDEATAFHWFRLAAGFGHRDSQFHLGRCYREGCGVRADADEALVWLLLAARQGDAAASGQAAEIAATLSLARIEAAQARAGEFRPLAPDAAANEETPQAGVRARRA
jgi:pilus assembly protein CpaE